MWVGLSYLIYEAHSPPISFPYSKVTYMISLFNLKVDYECHQRGMTHNELWLLAMFKTLA